MAQDKRVLAEAFNKINVQALARVIREKESSNDDFLAYTILNGGKHFTGFEDHPGPEFSPPAKSSAAGAYQFIWSTWKEEKTRWGLEDFSPRNQDLAFVARLVYRKALSDIIDGKFEDAVKKLRYEWTSLPGAGESSLSWTMDKAKALYAAYGGKFEPQTVDNKIEVQSIPQQPETQTEQKGTTMPILSILAAFGPLLAQLLPQFAKVLNPSEEDKKNSQVLQTAQMVVDTIVKSTSATNVQDAVEKLSSSPTLTKSVQEEIITDPQIMQLMEIGGGIEKAREFNIQVAQAEKPFWYSPTPWITLALIPLIYMVTYRVLWGQTAEGEILFSPEMQSVVITAIMAGCLGAITGFFMGTSFANKQKDDAIQNLSSKI